MKKGNFSDEKIVAVPTDKLTLRYEKVLEYTDLPEIAVQKIQHFFEHYKDLEPGKWVQLDRWDSAACARALITEAARRETQ